ncbi:hypothetical protein MHY1_00560 [Methylovirgula sp. HY1]|nr:hypothetical protein MHY1_00560 [Methylovirgula sp. HY1]
MLAVKLDDLPLVRGITIFAASRLTQHGANSGRAAITDGKAASHER